jgi:hypothetical protein
MAEPQERSHYQVLGVAAGASQDELRRAHRQLARVLHPDRVASANAAERQLAERRMREVNAAWTVLSNPSRRREYDRSLAAAGAGPGPRTDAGARTGPAAPRGSAASNDHHRRAGSRDEPDWPQEFDDEFDPDEEPLSAMHFWLLRRGPVIAALVLAVGMFIFTAYAGTGGDNGTNRTTIAAEDCVRVTDPPTAVRTSCASPNDGTIVTTVGAARDCPAGTRYVLLSGEERFTCVDGTAGRSASPGAASRGTASGGS